MASEQRSESRSWRDLADWVEESNQTEIEGSDGAGMATCLTRGEWREIVKALRAASSESRESEGYPGIAHDLETMRGVLAQVESYRMDCRCSMKERDSGHHVDCHVPEFQALQDMARNVLKNAAPQAVAQTVRASGKSAEAEDTEGRGFESRQPAVAAPIPESREWIACADREPPCANRYIATMAYPDGEKLVQERYFSMSRQWDSDYVTHWRPFPEAPK